MITDKTIVEIYEPGRSYSSGPNNSRKASKREIDWAGGLGYNGYICFQSFGSVIIQRDLPYKDVWFWHEKGHTLYEEIYGPVDKRSLKVERFCDDYMLFVCGYKRTFKALLRACSDDTTPQGKIELRKRIEYIRSAKPKFFNVLIEDTTVNVCNRLNKFPKNSKSIKAKVLRCWLKNLVKLCESFDLYYAVEYVRDH